MRVRITGAGPRERNAAAVIPDKKAAGYTFDEVALDIRAYRVARRGTVLALTPRAFHVLRYVVEHRDRLVERQELFDRFWPDVNVTDNALTRVIKAIRQALDDDATSPRHIATGPKGLPRH